MKERPILFSAPMVLALLAGTKTQTRRIVKPQPFEDPSGHGWQWHGGAALVHAGYGAPYLHTDLDSIVGAMPKACPYGAPGGRLWVRETWRAEATLDDVAPRNIDPDSPIWYAADKGLRSARGILNAGKNRPGMFMPRWASRTTLEVTDVRVERLHNISRDDILAEGVRIPANAETMCPLIRITGPSPPTKFLPDDCDFRTLTDGALLLAEYASLWEQINGNDSWAANPWVWAIEFKRLP